MGNPLNDIDSLELAKTIDLIVDRTFAMDFRWDWPGGVAFYGVGQAWRATGNIVYMERLASWVDDYLELGLPPFHGERHGYGPIAFSICTRRRGKGNISTSSSERLST